jgi:hypothetical protein
MNSRSPVSNARLVCACKRFLDLPFQALQGGIEPRAKIGKIRRFGSPRLRRISCSCQAGIGREP